MTRNFASAMQQARQSYLAPAARGAQRYWSWWLGQLAELVPGHIRAALVRQERRLIIEGADTHFQLTTSNGDYVKVPRSLPAGEADALPASILKNVTDIRLVLPGDMTLCKRIELPMATEENLRESVSFQLDRLTPFSASDVYFDCLIIKRNPGDKMLSIDLVVAPREFVDSLLHDLERLGMLPHRAFVTNSAGDVVSASELLPAGKKRTRRRSPRRRQYQVLSGVCALLAIAAIAIPIVQKERVIAILEPQVQTAIQEARAGADLRQRVEQLSKATRFLREKKQTRILVLETINEISRMLPDHTWINRLDLSEDELQIQGQSAAAASLIQLLEQSPMLSNVRFRSPVTGIGATGEERFHLSANVVRVDQK